MLHLVYCEEIKDTEEAKAIKKLIKDNFLWGFTGTLYVPEKGAYVQDHPGVKDGMPFMNESELVRKLEANDSSVRFVPFGFKTGVMNCTELAKNPYVIALAGQEGANQLGEIADTFEIKEPCLWSFKKVEQPQTRVSALVSYWDVRRLYVGGSLGGRGGCAFGVY